MKKAKKTLKILGNTFIWLFVIFSIFVTMVVLSAQQNADGLPSIGGKYAISVLTDSMSPTFVSGDIIIGEKLTNDQKLNLQIGDVITYYADLDGDGIKELNTHRIIAVNENSSTQIVSSYETQGDNKDTNMTSDDEPVLWQDIISKWTGTKVPFIGKVANFLQTSQTGFLVVIVLPLLAFFLYELYRFAMAIYKSKNKGIKQITAAEEEIIKQKAVEEYLKQQSAEQTDVVQSAEEPHAMASAEKEGTDSNAETDK